MNITRETLPRAIERCQNMIHPLLTSTPAELRQRFTCLIRRQPYRHGRRLPSPRWQQLELPLSRTPVKRWTP